MYSPTIVYWRNYLHFICFSVTLVNNVIPRTFIKLCIHCINTDELAILRYLTGLAFYMAFDLSNMTIYKVLLLIH